MKRRVLPFLTAVTIATAVFVLPVLLTTIDYNTRRMAQGEVAPAVSYRIDGGFTLVDGEGRTLAPLPSPAARAAATLITPWVRLSAALVDTLAATAAALWDNYGILTRP